MAIMHVIYLYTPQSPCSRRRSPFNPEIAQSISLPPHRLWARLPLGLGGLARHGRADRPTVAMEVIGNESIDGRSMHWQTDRLD